MASTPPSTNSSAIERFTSQASTAEDLLSSQTVGLVHLSDFRKRRAEALEKKELQASHFNNKLPNLSAQSTRPNSGTATPNSNDEGSSTPIERPRKKKKKATAAARGKLSFGLDEDDVNEAAETSDSKASTISNKLATMAKTAATIPPTTLGSPSSTTHKPRLGPNSTLTTHPPPRVLTKSAMRVENLARESLRRDFLSMQEAVRATPILIPFVFYDGSSTPGGVCKIKKGEHIWLVLDRARKVGAKMGEDSEGKIGDGNGKEGGQGGALGAAGKGGSGKGKNSGRSHWARIGVDDLLLVRGEVIIPHHYEIYYFIVNKTLGPNNKALFEYASTATTSTITDPTPKIESDQEPFNPLSNSRTQASEPDTQDENLEGATDDPNYTKVVDRRWYERNKHIFPASQWEEFDPGREYAGRVRKDAEGNAFFFS